MPEKKKSVVPRLRFFEFRDAGEWEVKRLGEVCEILDSQRRPITSTDRERGPYPYYGASGIVDYINDYIFDERLILIGEDGAKWGPFEKTAFIVEGKYWVNNHAHVLRSVGINDVVLENFLTMIDISPYITGAAPPKLTLNNLKGIKVPTPSELHEQQKIADCLSSLDEVIDLEAQKLDALKAHKKGLMQQLFPREGETTPRLRFPEFRDAGVWEVERFGKGYSFHPTNSFSRDRLSYESGTIKNIHYGDIHTKFTVLFDITKERVPYLDPSLDIEKLNHEAYCKESDIILADASEDMDDIGKSIEIVNLNGEKLVSGLHTIMARQKSPKLIVGFGGYLFKTAYIREQIKQEAQGAKVLGISPKRLSKISIIYPSIKAEQQKIADCLAPLDEVIKLQTQKLDALKAHKKGLMQQLFPQEVD